MRPYLYINGGKESDEARKVLDDANVNYDLIDIRNFCSTDVTAPRLVDVINFAGGFQGLDGVMGYIDAMSGKTPRNGMKFSNVLVP